MNVRSIGIVFVVLTATVVCLAVESHDRQALPPEETAIDFLDYSQCGSPLQNDAQSNIDDAPVEKTREVPFQKVTIQVFGGKDKKALRYMNLRAVHDREGNVVAAGLTDLHGAVALKLPPGDYYIELQPKKEVPYLGLPIDYDGHPWHYRRWIRVERDADALTKTFHLAQACELTLRAIDANTGEGIAGVVFVMENLLGEYYAWPINGDNLGAKRISDLEHAALETDDAGSYRRLLGPQEGWTYYVWSIPDGYEEVTQGEEVEIDTSVGTRTAGHTFMFRRKPDDSNPVRR